MEGLYSNIQIAIEDTTGTFISLANKQLISLQVEISIRQQRNLSPGSKCRCRIITKRKGKTGRGLPNK